MLTRTFRNSISSPNPRPRYSQAHWHIKILLYCRFSKLKMHFKSNPGATRLSCRTHVHSLLLLGSLSLGSFAQRNSNMLEISFFKKQKNFANFITDKLPFWRIYFDFWAKSMLSTYLIFPISERAISENLQWLHLSQFLVLWYLTPIVIPIVAMTNITLK